MDRTGRAAVRLLPIGPDHGRRGAARQESAAERCGYRRSDARQHLPLRDLSKHTGGYPPRLRDHDGRGGRSTRHGTEGTCRMITVKKVNRRSFLKTGIGTAAGLTLSFALPESARLKAQGGAGSKGFALNGFTHIGSDEFV